MRICGQFTCWTDYPFVELGDIAYQKAPIRHVKVLEFDQNKYVTVQLIDEPNTPVLEVKAGYLYRKHGRYGQVPHVSLRKIERMDSNKDTK
jgi:hypothetical protein